MQTTFINNRGIPPPSSHYRTGQYVPPLQQQQSLARLPPAPDVRDDYERWYTEAVTSNRMSLSIRSGIHSEITWALERLCRLSYNDTFFLFGQKIGIIDVLFDWPEWYVTEGYKQITDEDALFSVPPEQKRQRRYALESLFILRNASMVDENAREIPAHSHTVPLIMNALHNLDHTRDEHADFLLYIIDLFHLVLPRYTIYPNTTPRMNPIPPLMGIVAYSTNRSMIIASMSALTSLFSNPINAQHLKSNSPALTASIRYMPLFVDRSLVDVCLNYIYAHISHPSMARAFLLHSEMPRVLKVLANLLVHEQEGLEKKITLDITGTIHTVPLSSQATRDHELTKEELDNLVPKPEPQRCYDWMRTMFVAKTDGELTQVDFWNMYKDAFTPFAEQHPLLVASDVIKNVNNVFPQAQAMVLPGPVQRFVVRGVDRRKESAINERYRCLWDRSQCPMQPFASLGELYDHVLGHLAVADGAESPCLWSSCPKPPLSKHALSLHVVTHLSSTQPSQKHPSQSDTITLPSEHSPYPTDTPTNRPPPPPRSTTISYDVAVVDPPSTSLTALLIIRILFRTSFASAEAAPKVDADHFGFPGVVEDTEDPEVDLAEGTEGDEREGEVRGRKAFVGIRKTLELVKLRDEALMSWVTEMVDAGMTESIS